VVRDQFFFSLPAEHVRGKATASPAGRRLVSPGQPGKRAGGGPAAVGGHSRLEAFRECIAERGFPPELADFLLPGGPAGNKATGATYEAHWRKWLGWAEQRCVDPVRPTLPLILSFLLELFHEGRSLAAIRGARLALTSVFLDVDGTSLTDSIYLTRFISAMKYRLPANVRYGEHEVFNFGRRRGRPGHRSAVAFTRQSVRGEPLGESGACAPSSRAAGCAAAPQQVGKDPAGQRR
jgi:hypothetical protein